MDKSHISLHGEVYITWNFDGMELPIYALIVNHLDGDILAGVVLFCKENNVHLRHEVISINNKHFAYGTSKQQLSKHEIYQVESMVLWNSSKKVVMPGEFIEVCSDSLNGYEGEVAIEPWSDSANDG